jgi:alanine racemase
MTAAAPLRLLLDGQALVANWQGLKARGGGAACGAAVKADGYGLGARAVAARLGAAGCRDFFVATWAEAAALGPLPDGARLSVLHGVRDEDMASARHSPARPVLNSAAQVARWRDAGGGPCDVMVDTGMNRLGLTVAEARSGLIDGLAIDTLMSHLACADEPAHPLNARQRAHFAVVRDAIPAARYSLANSAGILLGADYAFDLTRPGLALYGGVPVAGAGDIRPVAAIAAEVIQRRQVVPGESVGYGATWQAEREARIAILNLGYADGYMRCFAPGGDVGEGDWLALDFDLPAIAARSGFSQYEILTGLNQRFERRWR